MAAIKAAVRQARKEAAASASFAAQAARVEAGETAGFVPEGSPRSARSPAGVGGLLGPSVPSEEWSVASYLAGRQPGALSSSVLRGGGGAAAGGGGAEGGAAAASPQPKPWHPRKSNTRRTDALLPPVERIVEAIGMAVTAPLRMDVPPAPLAVAYMRALSEQPDRRLAVERLLRDGGIIETLAHEICLAADAIAADPSLGAGAPPPSGATSGRSASASASPINKDGRPRVHSPARGGSPLVRRHEPTPSLATARPASAAPPSLSPSHQKLDELCAARDGGKMTQAEYVERRREVLNEFLAARPTESVRSATRPTTTRS